jgi:glutamyl-tRNA synthetase/nondiscriminating glutamyl-tRNA synthetase
MSKTRVRFAPSPTGRLHIGNARIALVNYIFSYQNNGDFILRIDDTDIERNKEIYIQGITDSLKWLGITFTEGPYFQSRRLKIYRDYAYYLIDKKNAYFCFCSEEDIRKEKQEAKKKNIPYRYSGKCRHLSKRETEENLNKKLAYVIRFKTTGQRIEFNDGIFGKMSFYDSEFGDFIILRSNGFPTYNFSSAIDDALFNITHVIRGEDHLSNTPKQILILNSIDRNVPKFFHLPIILDRERRKLSKREEHLSIDYLKKMGILPQAVCNFMALLGWHCKREVLNMDELIKNYNIYKVGKSGAVCDFDKLKWLNKKFMRILDSDIFIDSFSYYLNRNLNEREKRLALCLRDETNDLKQLNELIEIILKGNIFPAEKTKKNKNIVEKFIDFLSRFKGEGELKQWINGFLESSFFTKKDFYTLLRYILIGSEEGISISKLIFCLSKDEIIKRLNMWMYEV